MRSNYVLYRLKNVFAMYSHLPSYVHIFNAFGTMKKTRIFLLRTGTNIQVSFLKMSSELQVKLAKFPEFEAIVENKTYFWREVCFEWTLLVRGMSR